MKVEAAEEEARRGSEEGGGEDTSLIVGAYEGLRGVVGFVDMVKKVGNRVSGKRDREEANNLNYFSIYQLTFRYRNNTNSTEQRLEESIQC